MKGPVVRVNLQTRKRAAGWIMDHGLQIIRSRIQERQTEIPPNLIFIFDVGAEYRIYQWSTAGVLQVLPVILMQHKLLVISHCNNDCPWQCTWVRDFFVFIATYDWPAWTFCSGLLVGTYGNSILYTLELVAIVRYYTASKRHQDSLPLQAVVYFTFIVDTISTIATYASVYLVCN